MEMIVETVNQAAFLIEELSQRNAHIHSFLHEIYKIAKQSHLLSINASIEASKAGDRGKGFVIVAGEVKKMAEQSQRFTKEIGQLVEEIRNSTQKAIQTIQAGSKQVDEGKIASEKLEALLSRMVEEVKEIANSLQDMQNRANWGRD